MKTLTILLTFCALAVVSAREPVSAEKQEAVLSKCKAEHDIEETLLVKILPEQVVEDKIKCFYACYMEEFGYITEDGTFNMGDDNPMIPTSSPDRETFLASIDKCNTQKGANKCETAFELALCLK